MRPDDPRHGTNAGHCAHITEGTPACFPCRVAKAEYEMRRKRNIAYGRWTPYVPAGTARTHVRSLMQQGMTIKGIAAEAGIPSGRITGILYKRGDRLPVQKIRPELEAKILAVTTPKPARIDELGIARRLQALVALGHSAPKLAQRLGWSHSRVEQFLKGRNTGKVMADTFQKVDALYRDMCMTLPPERDRYEKYSAARSRNTAIRHGWHKPLAWDDIDDLNEVPGDVADDGMQVDENVVERILAGEKLPANRAEKYAVIDAWLARGDSANSLENLTGWAVWRMIRDRQKDVA